MAVDITLLCQNWMLLTQDLPSINFAPAKIQGSLVNNEHCAERQKKVCLNNKNLEASIKSATDYLGLFVIHVIRISNATDADDLPPLSMLLADFTKENHLKVVHSNMYVAAVREHYTSTKMVSPIFGKKIMTTDWSITEISTFPWPCMDYS